MSFILITQGREFHSRLVKSELERRRVQYSELELGLPIDEIDISGSLANPTITTAGGTFTAERVRRSRVLLLLFAANSPPAVTGSSAFAGREWSALLNSLIEGWERESPHPWLIGVQARNLQNRKQQLIADVERLGGYVPETRIYSTLTEEDSLIGDQWVAKALNSWEEIRPGRFFNTRLLSDADLRYIARGRLEGPLLLQRYIPHIRELRLYVAGSEAFAVELTSHRTGTIDFRLLDENDSTAQLVNPPEDCVMIARKLMGLHGITYCVFDLVQDEFGAWAFLDINSLGSWDYLEKSYELSITRRVIDGVLNI